jgi:serine/threonine protein kinase
MTVDSGEVDERWGVFEAELGALSSLCHPNIVHLYEHFFIGFQFYLILQYCPGGSLHDEIRRDNGLSIERFLFVGRQVVQAINYCHENGIAHRDIKPGNILLDDACLPRLADFGLSLRTNAGRMHRTFGGSFAFTAPEVLLKKGHDPLAADVWSLGVTLLTMMNGTPPWDVDSVGSLKQVAAQGNLKTRKAIPAPIRELALRMIVVDPAQRLVMKDIAKHPLFCGVQVSRPVYGYDKMSAERLKWDTILRPVQDDDSFRHSGVDDYNEGSDDEEQRWAPSCVFAARSLLLCPDGCKVLKSRIPSGKNGAVCVCEVEEL